MSVDDLQIALDGGEHEFFISLSGGAIRSSKNIEYAEKVDKNGENKFSIINEIDNTEQILSADELFTHSNIGKAILNGGFYQYNYEN